MMEINTHKHVLESNDLVFKKNHMSTSYKQICMYSMWITTYTFVAFMFVLVDQTKTGFCLVNKKTFWVGENMKRTNKK